MERQTRNKHDNQLFRYSYDLLDFAIAKDKQSEIEGVVHVEGTARIQVVNRREQNSYLFYLLTYLDEHYGIKALINTSFNIKGEPILIRLMEPLNLRVT